ncbi:hypothetical protein ACS0X5_15970 [Burkholderia gladioli]|uniref:hypothetical protein n=1 Tax=Burkholderia gladioli TaxID=28095 RepID=UPI003F79532E
MSGTGGTVYDATPPRSSCERLTFSTVLNSPVPDVVRVIEQAVETGVPVQLALVLEVRRGIQIVVAKYQDQTAGSITSDVLLRLIECMEQQNEYVADVKHVSGARVEVQVVRR